MTLFLYEKLRAIMLSLLEKVLWSNILEQNSSASKLMQVDLKNERACNFSVFYQNFGFLNFFCQKIRFWDSRINGRKIEGGDLLFTFVLLNRAVPDVETIYFVSVEQKNCLQKLPGVLVSKKDEVICSANK